MARLVRSQDTPPLVVLFWKIAVFTCKGTVNDVTGCKHTLHSCTKRKQGKHRPVSLYKVWAIKANDNRVIVIHNKTIQLMEGWLSGRRQRFAKPSIVLKAVQGFESLIFHQFWSRHIVVIIPACLVGYRGSIPRGIANCIHK